MSGRVLGWDVALIAQPVDRVVDGPLDGLARLAADRVSDLHAPGRPDVGDLEEDGAAIFGDPRGGNSRRQR